MWVFASDPVGIAYLVTHYFFIAFVASALLAYPIMRGLAALKSRQTIYELAPETHQKKQGTPTMGGLIILAGVFVSLLFNEPRDWPIVLWMLGFALIGFADDYLVPKLLKNKRGLGWKQKILPQILLAALSAFALSHRITAGWADVPPGAFHWPLLAISFFAFLVLFFCNAYNFADGLDGLSGSLGLLLCVGFIVVFALSKDIFYIAPFAAMAGAYVPFLFLNSPPAKVFMGDVGSLPLGAMFGAGVGLALTDLPPFQATPFWRGELLPAIIILSLIMIIELVPVPMQVAYYKLTKKRIFPMTPIHHSFELKGWPESKIVWTFILAQLVLVVLAIGLAANALTQR